MTFAELLSKSASDLEAMTDQQLLEYLGPTLKDCPPIDIAIVNAEEDKIKLEKQIAKDKLKEEKKKAKEALGITTKTRSSKTPAEKTSLKNMKPEDKKQMLEQLEAMNKMLEMQMLLQKKGIKV